MLRFEEDPVPTTADDDSLSLAVGGYAALEGDMGESRMWPCGFSAPERPQDGFSDDERGYLASGRFTGGSSRVFPVRYVSLWQWESWEADSGWSTV